MRIVSYLFISFFILSLASCSSDDDNNQEVTLLGKWNVNEMTMDGNFTEEGVVVSFNGVTNGMAGNDITFKDDNTFTGHSAPFEMEMHYVINGMPSTITQPSGEALPVAGSWSKEGDYLFLQETGGERTKYKIETFNATTLKLSANQDTIDMGEDFPAGAQFNVSVTLKR